MTTITLHIGALDKKRNVYPLKLFLHTARSRKSRAEAEIPATLQLGGQPLDPLTFRDTLLNNTVSAQFSQMGEHLFQLLSIGQVGTTWREQRNRNPRLRTLLEIEAEELQYLPWELAKDGMAQLALNPDQTFLRSYKYVPGARVAPFTWPVRALVVIGAYEDDEAVKAKDELRRIQDELQPVNRIIDVEYIKQPTIKKFLDKYGEVKPHILHFIGHGGVDAATNNPRLAFDLPPGNAPAAAADRKRESWTVDGIRNSLQAKQWIPRFVFINACRSNTTANQQQLWSVGAAFRELGVPAVLTMQADVKGSLAGDLAGEVYKYLAEHEPLDAALAKARADVSNQTGLNNREWALPSLSVSIPPEEVLPIKPKPVPPRSLKISKSFEEYRNFVDRQPARRQFLQGFYPLPPEKEERDVVVVHGDSDVGKTWVTHWCMEACAWQDQEIRYVEVAGEKIKDWLDVLLLIRDGDKKKQQTSFIHEPLNPAAFHQFNWELFHRLEGKEPPPWNGEIVEPKKKGLTTMAGEFARLTMNSFCAALVEAASVNPLLLVLDHFTKDDFSLPETHMRDFLIPHFINEVAFRRLPNVKVVLVLTTDEFRNYKIKELLLAYQDVPVDMLPPDAFTEIAREYFRYSDLNISSNNLEKFVEGLAGIVGVPWKPYVLKEFYDRAKKLTRN